MAAVQITVELEIKPIQEHGQYRAGTLVNMTPAKIAKALGFEANLQGDPYKVKHEWGFQVGDSKFGIWDYKGSARYGEFSTYGDSAILKAIFGENYQG